MTGYLSIYIAIIAIVIALTAVLLSIYTQRKDKMYKIIFKKLKNGDKLNIKETYLLQRLRKQMGLK
ncbi:hypothetical protein B2M27_15625 (plasmid) [Kluyvera intermedia]|uniref:Uncharacterized protein n=1 Tax=Kluyvera intermedia TaxID=61648 RepID=A0ABX3UD64_KLUIN|nr:hypothetical protein B2M27_15625 [Kluyvera intermedia]